MTIKDTVKDIKNLPFELQNIIFEYHKNIYNFMEYRKKTLTVNIPLFFIHYTRDENNTLHAHFT